METASLTLIGKPGCHLCDDARAVVTRVMDELQSRPDAPALTLDEVSILDDAALNAKYAEEIPVLLINGRVHNYWRIDPVRLATALLELT
ncbi:glutaredoxin family protein [Mycetocola miduiensis]|uniref:Glutaredoxin-like domain n=1 Tax=Mycetocola miduiensis TaxID=995034 RepID=A0A1I4YLZ3_9MICO|nr:glutaredoxin family protein [Mycetocola miduiensis]SFN39026.1 Glutaredoxin-like domain [Mycetocola miduiensis]